ncbi:MAG TPA: T9SS type A sorting domain-containing protein, partial [Chitinophagaceae bacterium]|nr:T9SS type A sorting domain-containing protein [Chitinophagaceae bacterium]
RLVIGSGIGAGLQFKGDCAIYNYGTFELQRNLTLENNASAATPNIVFNVLNNSVFKMSNQYFVISNAFSKFINNGRAEFWGIITDNQSTPGCVCLGDGSATKMAILINKVNNTYTAPSGNACVHVYQFSEFYGQLTTSPTVLVCAGSGHTSNSSCIPFGCHPNYWGAAQVFTNCLGCAAIAVLPARFVSFSASSDIDGSNKLQWEMGSDQPGVFEIMRSADEKNFFSVDSLSSPGSGSPIFNYVDKNPLPGKNYYMIRFTNSQTGTILNSKIVKVVSEIMVGFNIYPVPFDNKFFINYQEGTRPLQVLLTDVTGRTIQTHYAVRTQDQTVEVDVLDKLQTGLYIIHLQTDKTVVAKTVFKR